MDLKRSENPIRLLLFIASLGPFAWGIYAFYFDRLDINPFETLMVLSGHSALIFFLISFLITPLRRWLTWCFKCSDQMKWGKRLSDWNLLIRTRRMFGLYSFFYASVHLGLYLELELSWLWDELLWELKERRFIGVGLFSWFILLILTVTSPKKIQKKMKRWWRRTHRLVYPLSLLCCAHFLMGTKETNIVPYYLVIVAALLGHRLIVAYWPKISREDDTGLEIKRD